MRNRVWVWTAFYLIVYALQTFAYQTNWATAVVGLDKRVVRLEIMTKSGDQGVCSGWVVSRETGYVGTAQHCIDGDIAALTVAGRHGEIVRQNKLLDQAVVRTELKNAENMPLAKAVPLVGSEVAILGYAFGAKRLYLQFGRVSLPLDDEGLLVIDAVAIGGDSGGPTINAAGELVGMTSFVKTSGHGSMHLAHMVPASVLKDFFEPYLPKTP